MTLNAAGKVMALTRPPDIADAPVDLTFQYRQRFNAMLAKLASLTADGIVRPGVNYVRREVPIHHSHFSTGLYVEVGR
jgi:hypothetical protein